MSETANCRLCKRQLHGAIESAYSGVGQIVYIKSRETQDCNWERCDACQQAICKQCYRSNHNVCSETCYFQTVLKTDLHGKVSTAKTIVETPLTKIWPKGNNGLGRKIGFRSNGANNPAQPFQPSICPGCKRRLVGSIEILRTEAENLQLTMIRESDDCNWIQCIGCYAVICKKCCWTPKSGYCNDCVMRFERQVDHSAQPRVDCVDSRLITQRILTEFKADQKHDQRR